MSEAAAAAAGRRAAFFLCAALVLGLAGNMTFQALVPELSAELALSKTEIGWISTVNYLAYAAAAPLLVGLTDRIDARLVMGSGLAFSLVAGLGSALFLDGFLSALLWRGLSGIGIAGTYMPGLKALTDRTAGPGQARLQALYTAVYSVGTALSAWLAGLLLVALGWRAAFLASGLLPALAGLLLVPLLPHRPRGSGGGTAAGIRAALRQKRAMGFALAYGAHCWELFGFRTWLVAFLVFAAAETGAAVDRASIASFATLVLLLGLPASLVGNELASRLPRTAVVSAFMLASAGLGTALGLVLDAGFALTLALALLYGCLVMIDSAAITVGTVQAAAAELKGATLAIQTLLGSVGAMLAPLASGFLLDLLGPGTRAGWAAALACVAAGALLGPLALAFVARGERRG
ncbi:MAG: MFS transporter [Geminicoccaceae bacterium]|nr:MFS transporter [Geminicoccaceae bacterium]MCX8100942.1 MFS transporter [Geminicoccaceae bacterium]MDW8368631.1 MFS transporter [Geminicoccaceae bacterium]